MRLFVALALDALAKAHLERVTALLRRDTPGLRWSKPEAWHVTLQFLGNANEQQYAALVASLAGVRASPATFTLRGTGTFERAGILYADVEPTPSLLALERAVTRATAEAGFVAQEGGYHPHVTLARRRGRERAPELRRLTGRPLSAVAQTAHEFLLYESLLSPAGAEYVVRERFPLPGAAFPAAASNGK